MTAGIDRELELSRLEGGQCSDLPPQNLTRFEIDVEATGSVRDVLDRTKEVLACVLQAAADRWPSDAEWMGILPAWFVRASAPEGSAAQTPVSKPDPESPLSAEGEPDEEDEPWSVGAFVYWFLPQQREWWWWGADPIDDDRLRICLVVREPSFPHEALDWLLRAAEAKRVVDENIRDLMQRKG